MRWRRTPVYMAASLEDAFLHLSELDLSGEVIVDLENTLMPSGGQLSEFASSVNERLLDLAGRLDEGRLVLVTNRSLNESEKHSIIEATVVDAAGKPRTDRLAGVATHPALVLGDQIATDGFLARHLGVPCVIIDHGMAGVPWPSRIAQKVMRLVGGFVFDFRNID